jgi:hypothetical protein
MDEYVSSCTLIDVRRVLLFKVTKEDYYRKINRMVEDMKDQDDSDVCIKIDRHRISCHSMIYSLLCRKRRWQVARARLSTVNQ